MSEYCDAAFAESSHMSMINGLSTVCPLHKKPDLFSDVSIIVFHTIMNRSEFIYVVMRRCILCI